jgi:LacI family transcriptional regulator
MMMPPLTTIQMSRYDLARAAFGALRGFVEEPEAQAGRQEIVIPTELIVRESTGAPARK